MFQRILRTTLIVLALVCAALSLTRCQREWAAVPEWTRLIFPMDSGKVRIYQVIDSSFDNNGGKADVFFRRERNAELQPDLLGRNVRRLEVYRSKFADSAYSVDRIWTQYKDDQWGERTQENVRVLPLKFPVFDYNISWSDQSQAATLYKWNYNMFNQADQLDRMYTAIDSTVTVNGTTYEHCAVVENRPNPGPITEYKSYEIYAPNIGLILQYERRMVYDKPGGNKQQRFNPSESYIHYQYLLTHN